MNMNKVYFYIAALSIVIGGVWLSLPSDEQRAKMQQAAQKRKAEQAKKQATASTPQPQQPAKETP